VTRASVWCMLAQVGRRAHRIDSVSNNNNNGGSLPHYTTITSTSNRSELYLTLCEEDAMVYSICC
jgi:hypothetical protein